MAKLVYRFVLFVVILVGITSCLTKNEPTKPYTIAVWTAQRATDQQLYFVADDSATFVPSQTFAYPDSLLGERCYVEFNLSTQKKEGYNHVVDVLYIQSVPTWQLFDIHTTNQSDSLGNDPTGIIMAWVSGNYLNMMYQYYGTGTVRHSFTMARNHLNTETVPDSIVNLEFRHNRKFDQPGRLYEHVSSFDISSLAAGKTSDFYIDVKYYHLSGYYESFKIKVPLANIKQSAPVYMSRPIRIGAWEEN